MTSCLFSKIFVSSSPEIGLIKNFVKDIDQNTDGCECLKEILFELKYVK